MFQFTRNIWRKSLLTLGLLAILLSTIPAVALAKQDDVSPKTVVGLEDPNEVETFLDSFLEQQMAELKVPGLIFVMVKDGEVFFNKGYGFADREREVPFNGDTIVRGGSIIKTITALGLMQLAEEGRIDLDRDVNEYLTSFQIPSTYDEPITARQLLHYTGGLDSKFIGIRAESEEGLLPLREYLAEGLPERVRPPGVTRAYNDHEIALAGLLIEEVTGVAYEDYVQEKIFQPLGMDSTSMIVPEAKLDRVAIGYRFFGSYPLNYYYLHDAPGAGFNTTANDLAKYMIMHLQQGEFEGVRILGENAAKELHQTGFSHHPQLPGIAFAFDETYWGEMRILAKSGGAPGFQNRMLLIPEQGLGIYFTYNRDSTVPLRQRLERALLEAIYPLEEVTVDEGSLGTSADVSKYAGYYQDLNDYSDRSIEKFPRLMEQIQVTANEDGTINLFNGRMVQVEPGLFQWADSGNYAAFEENEDGDVTILYVARTAFERIPWYETTPVQVTVLGFTLITFLSGLVAWLVAIFKRNVRGRWISGLVSTLSVAFLIGLVILFVPLISSSDPPWALSFDPPRALLILLAIPFLALALTTALFVENLGQWRKKQGGRFLRLHNTLIVLASLAFTFFLHTWNLLGYRF